MIHELVFDRMEIHDIVVTHLLDRRNRRHALPLTTNTIARRYRPASRLAADRISNPEASAL